MDLVAIISQYYSALKIKYAQKLLPGHYKALNAICRCRTPDSGELFVQCPDCTHGEWKTLSCGHRSCPKCQNHEASQWVDRQQSKLLPVLYFMTTFTLPYELRPLTWYHQTRVYSIFFACVASALNDFGLNSKNLGAQIGMTMVLHTHTRRLDYHPHIHVVIPGGGVNKSRRQWKKNKGKYLFNEKNLAKVFRARFLEALNENKLPIPRKVPVEWIVDCARVGKGLPTLKYLSRYLYRGVINEKNIIPNHHGRVTFRYIESDTGETRYRTLNGEDFLFLVIQHVLPKGFRRVRDYGFLHGNAKKLLSLVQLILHVIITGVHQRPRPVFKCPCCKTAMIVLGFRQFAWESG